MLRWLRRLFTHAEESDSSVVWKKWTTSVNEHSVQVEIVLESPELDPTPHSAYADSILDVLRQDDSIYRRAAANELTDIFNEHWNDSEPLDRETFAARLRPVAIFVTGTTTESVGGVTYDAAGMFTEHTVWVALKDEDSVEEVVMQ